MASRKPNSEKGAGGEEDEGGPTNVAESAAERTVHVGKYTLLETIGEGAFGKVKVAVDEALGRNFAVRILDKARIEKEDSTVQVRREINVMRAVRHRTSSAKQRPRIYSMLLSISYIGTHASASLT
jgi:serine/threonine protein kinase